MVRHSKEALLSGVITAARLAAKKVLKIYNNIDSFSTTKKSDGSPLTKADQLAHEIITKELRKLSPGIPIISEEGNCDLHAKYIAETKFWLVDPLDGTKEFLEQNGEFTINIALIENNKAILAVVHVPVSDICYYACKGVGSFKQVSDQQPKKLSLTPTSTPKQPIRLATSRRHGLDTMQNFIDNIGLCECIKMGSSLKICAIADGTVDLYPRLGPTMEWDTAAAQCVLEQAGGLLLDPTGGSLPYAKKGLKNPNFLALGPHGDPTWTKYLQ